MGRRTFRRRFSRKQRGGALTEEEQVLWGTHLYADIHHDFGNIAPNFYNFRGDAVKPARIKEIDVMEDLFKQIPSDNWRNPFTTKPIEFYIPEITAQTILPISVPIVGIQSSAIVFDAGTFITNIIGAKNMISFGSILDQAATKNEPSSFPIMYKPAEGSSFRFPLSEFGFDSNKVGSICIKDLTESTTKVGIELFKRTHDAVSLAEIADLCSPIKAKPINRTAIGECGIFTSIKNANAVNITNRELSDKEVWFKIGKTLGDTLLVASILPEIGGTANPFLPSGGEGQWISTINKDPIEIPPTNFILKTGDILNHTRAVLKNASSILERPEVEGKVVKRYHFIPSKEGEVPANALESFKDNMVTTVSNGYRTLIGELQSLLNPNGTLKPEYMRTMVDSDNRAAADASKFGKAIKVIICHMNWLQSKMVSLVNKTDITADKYMEVVEFVRSVTPKGTIFGKTNLPFSYFIVTTATSIDTKNVPAIKIPYYDILSRARNGNSDLLSGDYRLMVLKRLQQIQTIESDFTDHIPTEDECLVGGPAAEVEGVDEFADMSGHEGDGAAALASQARGAPEAAASAAPAPAPAPAPAASVSVAPVAPAPASRVEPDRKRRTAEAPAPAAVGEDSDGAAAAAASSGEESNVAVKKPLLVEKKQGGGAGEPEIYRIPWEHPAMAELLPEENANIEIQPIDNFDTYIVVVFGKTQAESIIPTIWLFKTYLEIDYKKCIKLLYGLKNYYEKEEGNTLIEDTVVLERIVGELEILEREGLYTVTNDLNLTKESILEFNRFVSFLYSNILSRDGYLKDAQYDEDGNWERDLLKYLGGKGPKPERFEYKEEESDGAAAASAAPVGARGVLAGEASESESDGAAASGSTSGAESAPPSSERDLSLYVGSEVPSSGGPSSAPTSEKASREGSDVEGTQELAPTMLSYTSPKQGGLRRTYRKRKNAPSSHGTRKHQKLRNRTRNSRRV